MGNITRVFILFLFFFNPIIGFSQNIKNLDQNIEHYKFNISVNDLNDSIKVKSVITGTTNNSIVYVNLASNMKVDHILSSDSTLLNYTHISDVIKINTNKPNYSFNIFYSGVPEDGLIISNNKFGNRTFFGDNWPNRARKWLSVYDHPSDKATVEFIVKSPIKYTVVANGNNLGQVIDNDIKTSHFKTSYEISTKIMVIGVAIFETQKLQESPFVISSYVYPENKLEALYDYAIAPQIVVYFESLLGKYPFDKLYNVQSTTKYGGMENAGCIFYSEYSIDGKRTNESLLAHEIAHQWFGNSVTEKNWEHVWLSEGFATYMENMYMEHKYGDIRMKEIMNNERLRVLNFKSKFPYAQVVPTTVADPNTMLNAYSYQKGAWILHMLREKLGDKVFLEAISSFYSKYKYSNANTNDFINICEDVYGSELNSFLSPWLYYYQLPKYNLTWNLSENNIIKGKLEQIQEDANKVLFTNDVEIKIVYSDNTEEIKTIKIDSEKVKFEFTLNKSPVSILLDPNNKILRY